MKNSVALMVCLGFVGLTFDCHAESRFSECRSAAQNGKTAIDDWDCFFLNHFYRSSPSDPEAPLVRERMESEDFKNTFHAIPKRPTGTMSQELFANLTNGVKTNPGFTILELKTHLFSLALKNKCDEFKEIKTADVVLDLGSQANALCEGIRMGFETKKECGSLTPSLYDPDNKESLIKELKSAVCTCVRGKTIEDGSSYRSAALQKKPQESFREKVANSPIVGRLKKEDSSGKNTVPVDPDFKWRKYTIYQKLFVSKATEATEFIEGCEAAITAAREAQSDCVSRPAEVVASDIQAIEKTVESQSNSDDDQSSATSSPSFSSGSSPESSVPGTPANTPEVRKKKVRVQPNQRK